MSREKWSSGLGFMLAAIGSAVGIGNIWRFPYIVGENGGGAFLIPYIIAVFLFGLPLMILEFSMGRHFKTSVISVFSSIDINFKKAGFFLVIIMSIILSYYLVITGWVLAYTLFFIFKTPIPFSDFINSYYPALFFLMSAAISYFVVRAGVKNGIENLSKLLIPLLFLILFVLVAFALSLPDASKGIDFYLTPDFEKLYNPYAWTAAFGQAFFSLSVGTGIMLTYGSYMRTNESIVKSAAIITISDLFVAILGGLVIFPIVFSYGLDPESGVQLAFVTLPHVFNEINYGFLLGSMFFLLLFLAALTSAVSMLEVPVSAMIDSYGYERKKAAAVVSLAIIFIGGFSALSYTPLKLELFGKPILDIFDLVFGTFGIIVTGLVLTVIAGWYLEPKAIFQEMGGKEWIQKIFIAIIKYFIPAILLFNIITRLIKLM